MNPLTFYKCLADDTRLTSLMLINELNETCVCDLVDALQVDQPKISRHLAELRKCGILQDERRGKWVFYKLHPDLPAWATEVMQSTAKHNKDYFADAIERLNASRQHCCN